jgi:hypothetical protein
LTKELIKLDKYELDGVDRIMLKQLVQYPNTTQVELGQLVSLTKQAVNARVNKPAFKAALNDVLGSTEEHLKEAARRAARRLKKLVDHDDPEIAAPFVKMALANHLTQKVDLTLQPVVRYKTTVEVDGTLLQQVIDEDKSK